jgi:hypothetical protein
MQAPIKLVICDLDGCLINSSHRTAHYFKGDREAYIKATVNDTVIPQGAHVYRAFYDNPAFHMLFVTSRGDGPEYRGMTLHQIHEYVGPKITNDQLLMRPPGLHGLAKMSDEDYKPWIVQQAGFDLADVFMAFDDRQCVVDMWRARGIVCYHTAVADY